MKKRWFLFVIIGVAALAVSYQLFGWMLAPIPQVIPRPELPASVLLPYRKVAEQSVTVPGTDTPVTVGVWIENGKERYQSGETLTLYVGMRYDGVGSITVSAHDIAPLVSARVLLEGNSYGMQRGDNPIFFDNVDSLAAYYFADSQPRIPGWTIAWSPTEIQFAALPRRVTVPDTSRMSEVMGPG